MHHVSFLQYISIKKIVYGVWKKFVIYVVCSTVFFYFWMIFALLEDRVVTLCSHVTFFFVDYVYIFSPQGWSDGTISFIPLLFTPAVVLETNSLPSNNGIISNGKSLAHFAESSN